MIAYSDGFNHYDLRDTMLNNYNKGDNCLQCSETETWDHIVKYSKTIKMRKEFIFNLTKDLLKLKESQVEASKIFNMVEDVMIYLENGDKEEHKTSQKCIGV